MIGFRKTVVLTVLIALCVPAIAQAQEPEDVQISIFDALEEAGLLTAINSTSTVDAYTITLDWVYADVNMLAVQHTIAGLPPLSTDLSQPPPAPYAQLSLPDGTVFSLSGTEYVVQESTPTSTTLSVRTTFYTQGLQRWADGTGFDVVDDYFITQYGDALPETMTFVVQFDPATTSFSMPAEPAADDPHAFTVDVPLYPAVTLTPPTMLDTTHTVSVNDLSITLEEVRITPAVTALRLCYDLPDGGDWHPVVNLMIGDQKARMQSAGLTQRPTPEDTRRCEDQSYSVVLPTSTNALMVTVEALNTSIPETREYWESVEHELTKYDIDIDVVLAGGRYYDLVSQPEGMSSEDVGMLIYSVQKSLVPTITGPWIFEVALP